MTARHPLTETLDQMLREQLPNLFRLYLNPYVAQTCLCLARYVQTTWGDGSDFQTFLANAFDEALSGAIKLARYSASVGGRPTTGLIIDSAGRLGNFVGASLPDGGRVEFVPGLSVVGQPEDLRKAVASGQRFSFVVLFAGHDSSLAECADALRMLAHRHAPLVITCVDRSGLAAQRQARSGVVGELAPDIVVFDESFVNHDVPFAAFTARKSLYKHWNRPGKTTFHSTTYQPNTISTLHFMRCLEQGDPGFHTTISGELQRTRTRLRACAKAFKRYYSPSLYRAIRATGFDTANIRAADAFVAVNNRKVFDTVGGVACSIRGHNPRTYGHEIETQGDLSECRAELLTRLRTLTGLDCMLPAVSGATAVENALKIALVAQSPKRHVLALKSGFGGKTLFALTGTWNSSYKQNIDPLYGDVLYVDPFAKDATAQIDAALATHSVAVVQVELVQGVGGVRRVPEEVIRYLHQRRQSAGYLLLVDEVQTGMYRTGAFTMSAATGLTPDLLVLGKGASDMMFPFALLMYSAAVRERLERAAPKLPAAIEERYGYEYGYRTVLNVLRRAEELRLPERVSEAGALFTRLLRDGLASCKLVRDVRVYGLLIGIELDETGWPRRWFRKRLFWFYLSAMLRHRRYPVLVGFCQYEPNVLKITPPLTTDPTEIRQVCATIIDVLKRPFYRLFARVVFGALRSIRFWRRKNEHANFPAAQHGER
jgi:acetylornithine/succinyldiaminopimelate/putrescine aminotransferase